MKQAGDFFRPKVEQRMGVARNALLRHIVGIWAACWAQAYAALAN